MIAPDSTVDDFDATLTCEEFYMSDDNDTHFFRAYPDSDEPKSKWDEDEDEDEFEDEEYEDDDEDSDDEDEDSEDDYEDDEYEDDEYEDDDDEWEDMEDDVSDCFECDGSVSENGFAQLFEMERRGYFA